MNKPGQKTAMISSTARDLPEHRRMVLDACLRMGFQPIMMDHLAGQDRSASEVSVGIEGNKKAAIAAATKAYTLAWCDGISADGKSMLRLSLRTGERA